MSDHEGVIQYFEYCAECQLVYDSTLCFGRLIECPNCDRMANANDLHYMEQERDDMEVERDDANAERDDMEMDRDTLQENEYQLERRADELEGDLSDARDRIKELEHELLHAR